MRTCLEMENPSNAKQSPFPILDDVFFIYVACYFNFMIYVVRAVVKYIKLD